MEVRGQPCVPASLPLDKALNRRLGGLMTCLELSGEFQDLVSLPGFPAYFKSF